MRPVPMSAPPAGPEGPSPEVVVRLFVEPGTGPLGRYAAGELTRYIPRLWEARVEIQEADSLAGYGASPLDRALVVLGLRRSQLLVSVLGDDETELTDEESYLVRQAALPGAPASSVMVISAGGDRGLLYGAYELLEALGARFYLSGESLPAPRPVQVPDMSVSRRPQFKVRGFMPYSDFLCGSSTWDRADYESAIDAAARLRLNLFCLHFYTFEPLVQFSFRGITRHSGYWDTSGTSRWHKKPGRVRDFRVGRERFAPYEEYDRFGSLSALSARTSTERFGLAEADINHAISRARSRGMECIVGIEVTDPPLEMYEAVPLTDRYGTRRSLICPSSGSARELIHQWMEALVRTFPEVDGYLLWQSETGPARWTAGCECASCAEFRASHPLPAFEPSELLGPVSGGTYRPQHIRESDQTFLQWALLALSELRQLAPAKTVGLAGWYVEHMFRAAAPYIPSDMVMSSITEIDPWAAGPMLRHYGGTAQRQWMINWWEIDFRMWLPQPKTSAYPPLLERARAAGLEGVVWQHWRTRSVDENARYTARAMWDERPVASFDFYRDMVSEEWGEAAAGDCARAMVAFEEFDRWISQDLGWQAFAPDWAPPQVCVALEYLACHGPVPDQVLSKLGDVLAHVGDAIGRMEGVKALWSRGEALAVPKRAGDRLVFWSNRISYYECFLSCVRDICVACAHFDRAMRSSHPQEMEGEEMVAAIRALERAPVVRLLELLDEGVQDKGDLGTLVNLNNELWSRYRRAMDSLLAWFDQSSALFGAILRFDEDGSLLQEVVAPDALGARGQWEPPD